MSVYGFYAEVNIGCALILMLLLYSIRSLPTPQLKYSLFKNLVRWHIVYFLSDALWSLVSDGILPKNIYTVLLVNYLNSILLPIVAYSCFVFSEITTRTEMTREQIEWFQTKLRIPILIEMILLPISYWQDPGFWLDENLEPRGLYYFVLLIIPASYFIMATVRGVLRGFALKDRQNQRTYLVVACYTPGVVIAGVAQLFFSMTTPIFCFWCTFIILFVYLHLQNQLISTDSLTMLNNRNRLNHFLHQQREVKNTYVFMVDVDHFKQINDTCGHSVGDKALVLVAQALKKSCEHLNGSVFLCRYGGDEFLLLAPTEKPSAVVEQIRECLRDEVVKRGVSCSFTIAVSVGYALWNGSPDTFKDCLVEADKKMYEDKRLA